MSARSEGTEGVFGEGRPFSPVREGERSTLLDVLRGIAILGILTANLEWFRTPEIWGGYERPFGSLEGPYLFAVNFLAAGKFVTALSFLFGLGLALQFGRASSSGRPARRFLARRLAVLALFGAAHAILVWSGDILLLYAIYGLPFLLFVSRGPRTLCAWAAGIFGFFLLLGLVLTAFFLFTSTDAGAAAGQEVPALAAGEGLEEGARLAFSSGSYVEMVAERGREYVSLFPLLLLSGTQVFPMMLLGAAAAKAGWLRDAGALPDRARRAAVLGLLVGLPLNLFYALSFGVGPLEQNWYVFLSETVRYVGAPILALGWMGLIALWYSRLSGSWTRIAAVGRMALTNYLAQSVLMSAVFYGFGLYGRAGAGLAVVFMVAVWVLELLWSRPWLSRFSYGPAEWLWRRLSYGPSPVRGKA